MGLFIYSFWCYKGLKEYFEFYNNERFHQSLKYKTPSKMYNKKKWHKIGNNFFRLEKSQKVISNFSQETEKITQILS